MAQAENLITTPGAPDITAELYTEFGSDALLPQTCADGLPTFWVDRDQLRAVMAFLKRRSYAMLLDLSAIDERLRQHREEQPASDFTIFYHLMSFERNDDVRVKVALVESDCNLPSITSLWSNANWYEREVWDMFGITFSGQRACCA